LIVLHDESSSNGGKHICSVLSRVPRYIYTTEGPIQNHLDTI